ncbi:hypothetical protein AAFF_G00015390 [Aldrovandia affinis]|uniref:Uncharacterized protein n=1 Tax=Aldrovandia affinis TaxID=143900 RepID=A0AAD7WGY5_9TELE|nr:hypothetical protein AAFF_G00015390 [Aldrovandia affinis]
MNIYVIRRTRVHQCERPAVSASFLPDCDGSHVRPSASAVERSSKNPKSRELIAGERDASGYPGNSRRVLERPGSPAPAFPPVFALAKPAARQCRRCILFLSALERAELTLPSPPPESAAGQTQRHVNPLAAP